MIKDLILLSKQQICDDRKGRKKMSKNILVIKTSLRGNSNSDALADTFVDGAQQAGNHVETISLKDKQIAFCKGCLACLKTGSCIIRDDAPAIVQKMHDADVIVLLHRSTIMRWQDR